MATYSQFVLMTVHVESAKSLSLEEAARQLGVDVTAIDAKFGVITVDPKKGIFSVKVRSDALPNLKGDESGEYRGPFSDPHIGPYSIDSE
jgi:hypothetical protein